MPNHCFYDGGALRVVPDEHWDVAGNGPIGAALVFVDDPLKVYDPASHTFVDDVAGERARLLEVIRAARDAAVDGGCVTAKGCVRTDAKGLQAIVMFAAAADRAQRAGVAFGVLWPMADDTQQPHDAAAILAMNDAVLMGISLVAGAYETKRAALVAATTLASLWAVVPRGA